MKYILATVFLASIVLSLSIHAAETKIPLHAGVAETDITPPEGFPMAGYYHERLANGQHDPLKAKAIVFRQGETSAAFVVADLTGIARDLCVEVRRLASAKTGIAEKHIVVSATHSHTAPDYTGRLYEFLAGDNESREIQPYASNLVNGIVTAIVAANEARNPSRSRRARRSRHFLFPSTAASL